MKKKTLSATALILAVLFTLTACSTSTPDPMGFFSSSSKLDDIKDNRDKFSLLGEYPYSSDMYHAISLEFPDSFLYYVRTSGGFGIAGTTVIMFNSSPDAPYGMSYTLERLKNSADSVIVNAVGTFGDDYVKNLIDLSIGHFVLRDRIGDVPMIHDILIGHVEEEIRTVPNGRTHLLGREYTAVSIAPNNNSGDDVGSESDEQADDPEDFGDSEEYPQPTPTQQPIVQDSDAILRELWDKISGVWVRSYSDNSSFLVLGYENNMPAWFGSAWGGLFDERQAKFPISVRVDGNEHIVAFYDSFYGGEYGESFDIRNIEAGELRLFFPADGGFTSYYFVADSLDCILGRCTYDCDYGLA
jgi:hypothetical protein